MSKESNARKSLGELAYSFRPRKLRIAPLLALALILGTATFTGCATGTQPSATTPGSIRPGSINAFDSNAYDTLITIQAGIEQAKVEFANTPAAKEPLDKVRAAYNVAMNLYKAYHTAGVADPGKQAELQQKISAASASLKDFTATFKGKP
jgi:hypothetical protein